MKLFPPEPKIEIGKDGFDSIDKLHRKDFGTKPSALITVVEDPVVIAIDGGWGSGKTVFLKCWVGEHLMRAENADQVIYFDAFKNDFLDDPLVSLISALSSGSKKPAKSKIKKLQKAATALAPSLARITLAVASSGATELAGAIGEATIRASETELTKASETFWKREDGRRAAMDQFRKLLGEFAGTGKLIFVIDELDRCRPDYALSLLETIKHFFAVENVHFVLGVNLSELKNTVRARYGLDTAADAYLHKFIQLQMTLPAFAGPRPEDATGLVHFENIANKMGIPQDSRKDIQYYLGFRSAVPSLREVERLATYTAMATPILKNKIVGYRAMIHGAIVLKTLNHSVYLRILSGEAIFGEIVDALSLSEPSDPDFQYGFILRHFYAAWAGFMDQAAWDKIDDQSKEDLFRHFLPLERDTRIGIVIAEYLETFQIADE